MNSNISNITVHCDRCGQDFNIEHYIFVNEEENPELVEMIEKDIFFNHWCPTCKETYYFDAATVFCNKTKKCIFIYVPRKELIAETNMFVQDLIKKCAFDISRANIRICTTRNEFREKVILNRNKLDDRIIEIMKLYALNSVRSQGINERYEEIRCGIVEDGRMCIDFVHEHASRNMVFERKMYNFFDSQIGDLVRTTTAPIEVNIDWAIQFEEQYLR